MKISKITETTYKFNDKGDIIEKIVKETEYKDDEYIPVPYPVYPYSPITYINKTVPCTTEYTITCGNQVYKEIGNTLKKCGVRIGV